MCINLFIFIPYFFSQTAVYSAYISNKLHYTDKVMKSPKRAYIFSFSNQSLYDTK